MYHPEKFLPNFSGVEILEDGPGHRAVRRMTIGAAITVLEEITWDESTHTVVFRCIEHPTHSGDVINIFEKKQTEDGKEELWLTYKMNWTYKLEGDDPMSGMKLEGAVAGSIKQII